MKRISQLLSTDRNLFLDKTSSISGGSVVLSVADNEYYKLTVSTNLTVALTDFVTGRLGEVMIEFINAGSYAVSFPGVQWIKGDGTYVASAAAAGITFNATGKDFVLLFSSDGGTNIYAKVVR